VESVAGLDEPYPYFDGDEEDWDWDVYRSEGLLPDVDRYVALVERARLITADLDLDATITTKHGRTLSHRRVLLGLVAEYARHNGHADVVRELIDGSTGLRADNSNLPDGDPAWWRAYRQRLEDIAAQFDAR